MEKIIGSIYWVNAEERHRLEVAKLEYELKKFGRALSVSSGESDAYWVFGISPRKIDRVFNFSSYCLTHSFGSCLCSENQEKK